MFAGGADTKVDSLTVTYPLERDGKTLKKMQTFFRGYGSDQFEPVFRVDCLPWEWYIKGTMLEVLKTYQGLLLIFSGICVIGFLLSLLALPWLICRIPEDYFLEESRPPSPGRGFVHLMIRIAKNLLGIFFVFLGIVMLFTPGQGVLTLFMGLLFLDFPGKRAWIIRLTGLGSVRNGLNWIRKKKNVPPLCF